MNKIFLPDIRNLIYKQFLKLFENKYFEEFVNKLDEFEFILEIKDNTNLGLSEYGQEMLDSDIICVIYKKQLFKSRRELSESINIYKREFTKEEYAKNLIELNKKLVFLEGLGVFNNIQEIIDASQKTISEDAMENSSSWFMIEFIINEYCFFLLEDEVGSLETADDMQMEISEYHFATSIELEDISQLYWFSKLDKKTQELCKAGHLLLTKIDLKEKGVLLDYSPLLLDFIKAVESEMISLIDKNINQIQHDAKVFVNNHIILKQRSDSYKLKSFSKEIIDPKQNFRPSGLTFLYYLLTYFAQPQNIAINAKLIGFLSEDKQVEIGNANMLLRRIKENGYNRNQLIHSNIISSKSDFQMIYIDLILSLQLLASIK